MYVSKKGTRQYFKNIATVAEHVSLQFSVPFIFVYSWGAILMSYLIVFKLAIPVLGIWFKTAGKSECPDRLHLPSISSCLSTGLTHMNYTSTFREAQTRSSTSAVLQRFTEKLSLELVH